LTDLYEWSKSFTDAVDLFGVIGIRIFDQFEFFLIDIITGIDPDLFYDPGGYLSRIGCKMNIGNEGRGIASFVQLIFYVQQVLRLSFGRGGDAHELGPRFYTTNALLYRSEGIHGIGSGHRLHPDRMEIAKQKITNPYFLCFQTLILCQRFTI